MKLRKTSWLGILMLVLLIVSLLGIFGCSAKTTTTQAPVTVTATTTAVATTTATATTTAAPVTVTTTAAAPQTLTIGGILNLQNAMGLQASQGVQCMMDIINNNGGITVAGQKYMLKFLVYDDKNTQSTVVSATNRLVFEDKVKFIIHDEQLVESELPITEPNKVVMVGGTPSQATVKPGLNYSFFCQGTNFMFPTAFAWFVKNHPEATKTYVFVAPDDQNGHFSTEFFSGALVALGVQPKFIYYPASATDVSAVATKVMAMNPTNIDCTGGGDILDDVALKAIMAAGYKGLCFTGGGGGVGTLRQYIPVANLPQLESSATATDLTPPPTQLAKDLIAAYTARYGKWDAPSLSVDNLLGLVNAIQQANSLDPDAVMKVVYSGMKYTTLNGNGMMVTRPDLGPTEGKTRDSVTTMLIKTFD